MACHFMRIPVANRLEAIDYMVKFLVREVGWTIAETIANSGTSKDFTLTSVGEKSVDNPNDIYIRLQSQASSIQLYTYETYINSGSNTGAVFENTNGLVTLSTSSTLTVVADLERVFFHVNEGTGTTRYFGYAGRIASYYPWTFHPYPHAIKGMTAVARDFFSATSSIYLRRLDGTVVAYTTLRSMSEDGLQSSAIAARTRRPSAFSYPLEYTAVANQAEKVGELRGIYNVPEETVAHGDYIDIAGRMYWCFKGDGVWAWAAGPISENNLIPPTITPGTDLVSPL